MHVQNCILIKPLHCSKETNAVEVAKILRENQQRRIIIVDAGHKPVGIVSTTDINNRVVAEDKDASKLKAQDIMTPVFLVCDLEDDLNEIFKKMVHHETFFVPVTKDNKLYAVLTYGELLKCINEKMKDGNTANR